MKKKDDALTIANPRLISAVYFGLLAVIANIFIDSILYSLGVKQLMATYQAIFLAVAVAASFGALYGKLIIHAPKPYKAHVFWWGVLLVITALPVHTIGFLFFFAKTHPHLFDETSLLYYIEMFALVLFYSFILFGIWLSILGGIAAVYLRGHLIYHLTNALYSQRRRPMGDKHLPH